MEIKVGDKVRVREDAPKILRKIIPSKVFDEYSEVIAQDDEMAVIWTEPIHKNLIPTKYLVKVEDEAKEPKFEVGDKVKVNLPRSIRHNTIGTVVFAYVSGNAVNVDFGDDNEPIYCDCDCLELYTEPTEQTEVEKPNHTIKIPVEVDLTESFWDAYTADLAKEIALKVANKYTDPKETADYAVSVAKAVVEGLKGK